MAWFDFLAKDAYQKWFERDRFERETEPKETWLTKAYGRFREGVEAAQPALPSAEPSPMERFRQVEREQQPAAPERPSAARAEVERAIPEASVLQRMVGRHERGREIGEAAMISPEAPIIQREKPGPREQFAMEFREKLEQSKGYLLKILEAGLIDEDEAQRRWEQMPQLVIDRMYPEKEGKTRLGIELSNIGLGKFMGREVTMEDVKEFEEGLALFTMTPLLPEEAYKPIGRVPVVGKELEEIIRGLTTPVGLALTALFPELTALMVGGEITGYGVGKGIERGMEEVGLPTTKQVGPLNVGPAGVLQTAGAIAAPTLGPKAGRGLVKEITGGPEYLRPTEEAAAMGLRVRVAAPEMQATAGVPAGGYRAGAAVTGRATVAEVERLIPKAKDVGRRLLTEEAGGGPLKPGRTVQQIDADIAAHRVKMENPKLTPPEKMELNFEWDRLWAERARITKADIRVVEEGNILAEEAAGDEWLAATKPRAAKPPTPTAGAGPIAEQEARWAARETADKAKAAYREQFYQGERAGTLSPQIQEEFQKSLTWAKSQWPHTGLAEQRSMALGRMFDHGVALEARAASPPAPKPAAQAFREATEPRAFRRPRVVPERPAPLEEAPAWELSGRGTVDEIEAITAQGVGKRPPPPRKPPTAEAVPPSGGWPDDPVPKLIKLIKAAKPVRAETEALKTAAKRKQAAAMGKIFETHPGEAPYRAKGVLKGELPSAAYTPPRDALSEGEIVQLRRQIRSFFEKEGGRAFDELSVREALEGMLSGKQPTWGEIAKLQAVFGRKLGAALEGKMPLLKRVGREALEIWNLGRTFKASLDQSWHMRQGIRLGPRHLKESVREGARGMKALWSQRTYEDSVRFIRQGQEAGEMSRNLFIGRVGPGATTLERTEAYISKWSDIIPLIKHTGREYATSGNLVRGAINRNLNRTWTQRLGRALTEEEKEWTGRLCNWGTGRGPLPDDFRGLLAGIFFAPGYRTAGPAYFSLLVNPKTPGFVRRMVAEELVMWVGTGVGLMTLLEQTGLADVEGIDIKHPGRVSSDFGKIRVGKMRFDIWGGSQQQARAILGLITGERKTLSTGEIMDLSRQEVISRYIESGYQPSMGLSTSAWTGKDWEGKPLTPLGAAQDLLAPMAAEDIIEAVREEGALGWIAAPFAHLGVGVWTPDLAGVAVNELTKRYDEEGRGRNQMAGVEFDILADENPDLAKARQDQIDEAAARGSEWAKFTLKRQDGDAEFEKGLLEALFDPKGRTWEQMGNELDDHLYEWAIRSDEFYGELDLDPRDDLERRINAFYAIEMPSFATEEERNTFFTKREKALRDDPELADAIHNHQVLRFTDSTVRHFVDLKWQSGLAANEYYSIPKKTGMTAAEQEQVRPYVEQATDIERSRGISFPGAVALIPDISDEMRGKIFQYKDLPDSDARKYWRLANPLKAQLLDLFSQDIPLGMEAPGVTGGATPSTSLREKLSGVGGGMAAPSSLQQKLAGVGTR